jgi:hypothetical protein
VGKFNVTPNWKNFRGSIQISIRKQTMSALGQQPAARRVGIISVYLSRAHMREDDKDVRIVPKGDIRRAPDLPFISLKLIGAESPPSSWCAVSIPGTRHKVFRHLDPTVWRHRAAPPNLYSWDQ